MLAQKNNLKCIKMIDFGLSKQLKDSHTSMHTMSGSPYYIAPEVFLQSYHLSIDIWSMGVVCYILLAGYSPFFDDDQNKLFEKIKRGKISKMLSNFHLNVYEAFYNLMFMLILHIYIS